MVEVFGIDQSVVSRHINNIFKDQEIGKNSNMQKMHNANSDKPVHMYSLDVVLAVGYRTNSTTAIIDDFALYKKLPQEKLVKVAKFLFKSLFTYSLLGRRKSS
jgi:hypothetical protein